MCHCLGGVITSHWGSQEEKHGSSNASVMQGHEFLFFFFFSGGKRNQQSCSEDPGVFSHNE